MQKDENIVCEIRYCPGCGTEIFCDVVSAGEGLFYLSEKMDQRIVECPECGLDFAEIALKDLGTTSDREKKKSPEIRTTAGKKDVVNAILEAAPDEFPTKSGAERALNTVRDALLGIASTGENIRWSGIGTFKIKELKARRVRNPQTGEMMEVPARKAIKFTPAKRLKEIVEGLTP